MKPLLLFLVYIIFASPSIAHTNALVPELTSSSSNTVSMTDFSDPLQPYRDEFNQGRPMTLNDIPTPTYFLINLGLGAAIGGGHNSFLFSMAALELKAGSCGFSDGYLPTVSDFLNSTNDNPCFAQPLVNEDEELRIYHVFSQSISAPVQWRETFRINGTKIISKVEMLIGTWQEQNYTFVDINRDVIQQ